MYFIFPPHLTSASALPGETGNPETASFHLNAACFSTKKNRNTVKNITWSELNHPSLSKRSSWSTRQDLGIPFLRTRNKIYKYVQNWTLRSGLVTQAAVCLLRLSFDEFHSSCSVFLSVIVLNAAFTVLWCWLPLDPIRSFFYTPQII